jgi:hypothetical protein
VAAAAIAAAVVEGGDVGARLAAVVGVDAAAAAADERPGRAR